MGTKMRKLSWEIRMGEGIKELLHREGSSHLATTKFRRGKDG